MTFLIGIDEAGRGPWAGPVVAAAVALPSKLPSVLHGLNDSKKLSLKQREKFFDLITQHALSFGIAESSILDIDTLNIWGATQKAMSAAYQTCMQKISSVNNDIKPEIIVDGSWRVDGLPKHHQTQIQGDAEIPAVMAASILAKVTRDRRMVEYHELYPHYHFHQHKGYGTALHQQTLQSHGPCAIHRRSFAPVAAAEAKTRR